MARTPLAAFFNRPLESIRVDFPAPVSKLTIEPSLSAESSMAEICEDVPQLPIPEGGRSTEGPK